ILHSPPLSEPLSISLFFFFTAPAPPAIYTLSLHDALPISFAGPARDDDRQGHGHDDHHEAGEVGAVDERAEGRPVLDQPRPLRRSEEHTSELQSRGHLVCRLLLEKKKKQSRKINKGHQIKQ